MLEVMLFRFPGVNFANRVCDRSGIVVEVGCYFSTVRELSIAQKQGPISPFVNKQHTHYSLFLAGSFTCLSWQINPQPDNFLSTIQMVSTDWLLSVPKPVHSRGRNMMAVNSVGVITC